ncbi:hypothetical protein ABZ250_14070 [Streptomyces afghaniensis]|uniref:hypothetical protein n=1 Tax=Streptomyces afghaniensis TaxID=66865 RepID=UPI0033AE5EF4
MFSAMRPTLSAERGLTFLQSDERGEPVTSHHRLAADVLQYPRFGGAEAPGEADRVGSITPGRLADLVLLRQDTPSMTLVNNPAGHPASRSGAGRSTPGGWAAGYSGTAVT